MDEAVRMEQGTVTRVGHSTLTVVGVKVIGGVPTADLEVRSADSGFYKLLGRGESFIIDEAGVRVTAIHLELHTGGAREAVTLALEPLPREEDHRRPDARPEPLDPDHADQAVHAAQPAETKG
jgi:hypothetical protein